MGFLEAIQADLVDHDTSIASTLLKLRLLAGKLGSDELVEWIKQEAEGYDSDAVIPSYRVVSISFSGTFHGAFGSGVKNAPIPPWMIKQFAGDDWLTFTIRESAAAVERMSSKDAGLHLDLSNLMILLRGKVYPNYEPAQVVGYVSQASLIETSNAIRNRLLEITIEIAKKVPGAEGVELSSIRQNPEATTQIFSQTIHGSMTNIQSSGSDANIHVTISQQDSDSLQCGLQALGLPESESLELANLIAEQEPSSSEASGLNDGARRWLANRITNGIDSGIRGGLAALTRIAQEAAMQYWGLK